MATYAIGDLQGCFRTLEALLARVGYAPESDRVVLVGDLVNRGPGSAEVLRWAMQRGERVVALLGNHDLHLLARHFGVAGAKKRDSLDAVLGASDREAMIDWLRARPLAHREGECLLIHAGLLPGWTAADAERHAAEVSEALRGPSAPDLLARIHERPPLRWRDDLDGTLRLRVIVQALTHLRTCLADGTPDLEFSGPPSEAPPGRVPWFEHPSRAEYGATVVFGHWAALGLHLSPHAIGLDTGAGWGNALTALRLEDRAVFHQPTIDELPRRAG